MEQRVLVPTHGSTSTAISLDPPSSHVFLHARLRSALFSTALAMLLATLFAALPIASAQQVVIGPLAIVVNPLPTFEVDVFLDKAPSGNLEPLYGIGESVRIGVEVSESAWVYLFDVGPDGQITQILPNRFGDAGSDHFVRPGQTKYFPPRDAPYAFTVAGPRGLSKILAVASKVQLDTRQLATFEAGDALARSDAGQDAFARAFSIVVRPIDPDRWVTDTALYYVGERPRQSEFGTLSIRSEPSGADAYVGGDFVGYTPVEYDVRAGNHRVEVGLEGYESHVSRVDLAGGDTRRLEVRLDRIAQTPTQPTTREHGAQLFDAPALFAPAGVHIVEIERERDETEARLVTDIDTLYRYLHRQLTDLGWSQRELDRDGDSVEAEYRRGGMVLEIEIDREGGGEVSLEIELDDD